MQSANTSNVSNPAQIVSSLGLTNGDFVADFGSGHGYYVIPLAQAVAPNGKVFAIDIQRHVLDVTRAKSKFKNIQGIEYMWADIEQSQGSKLKNDFVDLVLIANILHQTSRQQDIIKEAYRVLYPFARLALIEWKRGKETTPFGPPHELRIDKQAAINLCASQSFVVEREFDAGSHHYGILFAKK